ncbi:MAG: class I SAM-dependent methyltransferase [Acidimicrobiales bacterium]
MVDRWQESDVPRGADYDRRFEDLAATGMDMHGEASLVASYAPTSVLDAGCGTGRVAIELGRRGFEVVGVDIDEAMLDAARAKAPDLTWVCGDLADPGLDFDGKTFDLVVMAGNVLIFVPVGAEGRVIENAARWLRPGGHLVTGYSIRPDTLGPRHHDTLAAESGLVLEARWSTWDGRPFARGDRYAVAVHRREI